GRGGDGQNDEFAHGLLLRIGRGGAEARWDSERHAQGRVPLTRKAATSRTRAGPWAAGVAKVSRAMEPPSGPETISASPRSCFAKATIRVRPTPAEAALATPGPSSCTSSTLVSPRTRKRTCR